MLVIPFVVMLAVTGTLVLYEDPINDITDHDLTFVAPQADEPLPLDEQVEAVEEAFPGFEVGGVTPPAGDDQSTMVALAVNDTDVRNVYVNPYSGELLGSKIYRDDVPGLARLIHGTILFDWKLSVPTLAGITGDGPLTTPVDVGDILVELMACWGVVLVVSGLYLWWPRKREAGKALFRPRLHMKGRARWRDLHAIPGAVLSLVVLFLIVTGLPWSGFWGGNFNHLATTWGEDAHAPTDTSSALARTGDVDRFGNPIPWASQERAIPASGEGDHHEGDEGGGGEEPAGGAPASEVDREAPVPERLDLDEVADAAAEEGMVPGFSIAYPIDAPGDDGEMTYGSYTVTNAYNRTASERTLYLDQFTGEPIADHDFGSYGLMAKASSWGIDVHMGTEYGLINRIVMTLACVGVVWSAISGLVMWWKRRPHGKAGLPRRPVDASLQRGLIIIAVVLGVLFPLVGVSMIAVVLLDRFVIRRVPRLRRAFGMRSPRPGLTEAQARSRDKDEDMDPVT
jgi:uncharacterized iron-regulated membrane protein